MPTTMKHPERVELKRAFNLAFLTFYGLGTILGAGIYVLVGKVAGIAGLYAPVAFLVAAVVAAMTALSYAELPSRFPKSAGEAIYVQEGFGVRALSIVVGLLLVLSGLVSSATLANGFVGYFEVFVDAPRWLVIMLLVAALSALAVWGIAESAIAATDAPLALMFERATGQAPVAIAAIGLFAVVNGALVQIIMGARVLYGMSQARWLPRWFGRDHAGATASLSLALSRP